MALRGQELRLHLLDTAKDLFLESGFERTSMDAIAVRARASKQTLYAHFTTKDTLYRAVIERMGELFETRLRDPEHYSADAIEAAALFCGRFVQLLHWSPILRTWRTAVAEAEREPAVALGLSRAFFDTTTARLSRHLSHTTALTEPEADRVAADVLAVALYPTLPHLMAGVIELRDELPDEARIALDVDLARIESELRAAISRFGQS